MWHATCCGLPARHRAACIPLVVGRRPARKQGGDRPCHLEPLDVATAGHLSLAEIRLVVTPHTHILRWKKSFRRQSKAAESAMTFYGSVKKAVDAALKKKKDKGWYKVAHAHHVSKTAATLARTTAITMSVTAPVETGERGRCARRRRRRRWTRPPRQPACPTPSRAPRTWTTTSTATRRTMVTTHASSPRTSASSWSWSRAGWSTSRTACAASQTDRQHDNNRLLETPTNLSELS